MIVVTGGAGFIGSAIVWKLNSIGREDIIIVDHLGQTEKWRNLVPLRFIDYFEKDDFLREIQSNRIGQSPKIDAIIHMGACSATTEQDATYLVHNNFEYSKELAVFAAGKNIRFIFASSAATYGDGKKGFTDDEEVLESLQPLNMYGYSKQMFDIWAKRNGILKLSVGLKFFNVFGPNEYHKGDMRSLVLKAYEQIRSSSKLQLFKSYRQDYKDGEQRRDFIYVKDAVELVIFFLLNKNVNGLFNVGSGVSSTWNQLAHAIFKAMSVEPKIEYIDMPGSLRDRYQYHTCADMNKVRAMGFGKQLMPLETAVEDYVKNYLIPGKTLGT